MKVSIHDIRTGELIEEHEIDAPDASGPDIVTLADQVSSIMGALDMLILNEFGA